MTEFEAVKLFAAALGWKKVRRGQHKYRFKDKRGKEKIDLIVWYDTGSVDDVLFQVNQRPPFSVAVYAVRYRLCTGWHRFKLSKSREKLKREADRLRVWVHREHFVSLEGRRQFRIAHPECSNLTWKKLLEDGPPYK